MMIQFLKKSFVKWHWNTFQDNPRHSIMNVFPAFKKCLTCNFIKDKINVLNIFHTHTHTPTYKTNSRIVGKIPSLTHFNLDQVTSKTKTLLHHNLHSFTCIFSSSFDTSIQNKVPYTRLSVLKYRKDTGKERQI